MIDFLRRLITTFETTKIPYMLSGSVAMSIYTGPRFTRDYDFIVHLKPDDVNSFVEQFKDGYYCNKDSVLDAISNESLFNIIDFKSGYKADFVILKNNLYRLTEFERRKKVKFLELMIDIVSAEDLLISKIIWIQESQSGIQMEDIKILSEYKGLDWNYINYWIKDLKLKTFNLL